MKLIFIHGRDQQGKDPDALKQIWVDSLSKGLKKSGSSISPDLDILFPFYGDMLAKYVQEAESPVLSSFNTKGAGVQANNDSELSYRYEILKELLKNAGIPESEVDNNYEGSIKEKGPLNWPWVHAILRTLDQTPLGLDVIDRFTRDVYIYLVYRKSIRKNIDSEVLKAFPEKGEVTVVGHSLGSVVGYNVLMKLPPEVKVRSFITLGSPLGINAIHRQLDRIQNPPTVKTWFNALDPGDVVALRPLLKKPFDFLPTIVNKVDVDNFTDNQHGIEGYLQDPEVADKIWHAIQK